MHGGAKTLHPAMHGCGIDPATWRCMAEVADVALTTWQRVPATWHFV